MKTLSLTFNGQIIELPVKLIMETAANYLLDDLKGQSFDNPEKVKTFLKIKLGKEEREIFACLFLDNQHRLIEYSELFYGTIDGASVYPREVVKAALHCNAAAVIFSHNHPSGTVVPSSADIAITSRLKDALSLIDVRVLDHIIVGGDNTTSFAETGRI